MVMRNGPSKNITKKYNRKDLADALERNKRYLKTKYPIHCADDRNNIASHSASFALSHPKEKDLQQECELSDFMCKECNDLCISLQSVHELATEMKADKDTFYDIDIAIQNIQAYVQHVMRNSQQKKAKVASLEKIDGTCALWTLRKRFCHRSFGNHIRITLEKRE